MMDDKERDTHFQNAAELLSEKLGALYLSKGLEGILGDPNGEIKQQEITLIAQFAYDLVEHALYYNGVDATNEIPDLTEWPKTT